MSYSHAPETVEVSATDDGDNTLVAAVAGKSIKVLAYVVTVTTASAVEFKSGASTVLATLQLPANGGVSFAGDQSAPAFATAEGEALVLENAAANDSFGHLTYVVD